MQRGDATGLEPWHWKPGQVTNPMGRPKEVAFVRELARQRTVQAIDTLTEIMLNKKCRDAARVAAANALLDRGYGRAPLTFQDEQEQPVDLREAARRIAFIMNGAILRGDDKVIDADIVEVVETPAKQSANTTEQPKIRLKAKPKAKRKPPVTAATRQERAQQRAKAKRLAKSAALLASSALSVVDDNEHVINSALPDTNE